MLSMICVSASSVVTRVAFVLAGGGLGSWQGTRLLYLRDLGAPVFGDEEAPPRVRIRHQLRRIIWTAVGAVGGLVAGQIALTFLAGFLE